jgi:hypothetical protein
MAAGYWLLATGYWLLASLKKQEARSLSGRLPPVKLRMNIFPSEHISLNRRHRAITFNSAAIR